MTETGRNSGRKRTARGQSRESQGREVFHRSDSKPLRQVKKEENEEVLFGFNNKKPISNFNKEKGDFFFFSQKPHWECIEETVGGNNKLRIGINKHLWERTGAVVRDRWGSLPPWKSKDTKHF